MIRGDRCAYPNLNITINSDGKATIEGNIQGKDISDTLGKNGSLRTSVNKETLHLIGNDGRWTIESLPTITATTVERESASSAPRPDDCRTGMIIRAGDSCIVPGMDDEFWVSADGKGHLGQFMTAGTGININDFAAEKTIGTNWKIESVPPLENESSSNIFSNSNSSTPKDTFSPKNTQEFNRHFVGKTLNITESHDAEEIFYSIEFMSNNRFIEAHIYGGTYAYSYDNSVSILTQYYDDDDYAGTCRTEMDFISQTAGTLTYTCDGDSTSIAATWTLDENISSSSSSSLSANDTTIHADNSEIVDAITITDADCYTDSFVGSKIKVEIEGTFQVNEPLQEITFLGFAENTELGSDFNLFLEKGEVSDFYIWGIIEDNDDSTVDCRVSWSAELYE